MGLVVVAAGIVLAALRVNPYLYFAGYVVLQYVVIATAWNILGGYAGYVNFGTPAFFAMGAYTAVFLIQSMQAPLPVLILAGGLVAALLGLGIGYLTLRLRGVFFSIATLALSVVLQTMIMNWEYVGGSRGLSVIRPSGPPFGSYVTFLFTVMVGLAVVAVLMARFIERSWIGRGLAALRDNEEAAECMGVPTLRLKLFATTVSGFLLGVAGAPFPYYVTFVEPNSAFALDYAVNALAMPMIGGTTSWVGPVIGAVLLGDRPAARDRDDLLRDEPVHRGRRARRLRRPGARGHPRPGAAPARPLSWRRRLLEVDGLVKRFGGFTALNGVDPVREGRRALRPHRPQRLRQDHAHQLRVRRAPRGRRRASSSTGRDDHHAARRISGPGSASCGASRSPSRSPA